MPRRIVDISMHLENDVVSDPRGFGPKIRYFDHKMSLGQMLPFFPGLKAEDLPDGEADYVTAGCGMGYAATMYLLERGVRLTGTDAWSWDAPFVHTAEKYRRTGDAKLIWEGHKAGREIGYCHLEKLHSLEALPGDGFMIACFPVKIRGASAGWTRAVAIFDDAILEASRRGQAGAGAG